MSIRDSLIEVCRLPLLIWFWFFQLWYQYFGAYYLGLFCILPYWSIPLLLWAWDVMWYLSFVSLMRAIFTLPPDVPEEYKVPESLDTTSNEALAEYAAARPHLRFQLLADPDKGGIKVPRICEPCGCFKVIRVRHCRTCRRCVPRLDHHCPVLGTCVHSHNMKFFLLACIWAVGFCLLSISLGIWYAFNLWAIDAGDSMRPYRILLQGITNAVFGYSLMPLFAYIFVLLVLRNRTKLELSLLESYDLGSKRKNFESVFGSNWRLWLVPVPSTPGTGFDFDPPQRVPATKMLLFLERFGISFTKWDHPSITGVVPKPQAQGEEGQIPTTTTTTTTTEQVAAKEKAD